MRQVILAMFMSLDGYFAGPGGEFIPPPMSDDLSRHWSDANVEDAGTLLYGRVSFEFNSQFWPSLEADPTTPNATRTFARRMNDLPKVVFSTTLKEVGWNARVVGANVAGAVEALRHEPGKDMVLIAGADLASSFMKLDLIDVYRILITPTLLGEGIPLFRGGFDVRPLELMRHQALDSGAMVLEYRRPR